MKKRYSEDLDYFLKRLKSKHINLYHDKSLDDIKTAEKFYNEDDEQPLYQLFRVEPVDFEKRR